MPQVIVILSVWRGVVQDVFYSHPEVQVTLVDWDVEESYPDAPGIVEIDTDASCSARAYVADIPINSQAILPAQTSNWPFTLPSGVTSLRDRFLNHT